MTVREEPKPAKGRNGQRTYPGQKQVSAGTESEKAGKASTERKKKKGRINKNGGTREIHRDASRRPISRRVESEVEQDDHFSSESK